MPTAAEPPTGVVYLDTSALVKLVVHEPETTALRAWLQGRGAGEVTELVTSTLTGVELRRAARRHSTAALEVAERILGGVHQVTMTPDLLIAAGRLEPPALRSLDAIHLATAQRIGSSLSALVAYDDRLLAAATSLGLPVANPGPIA